MLRRGASPVRLLGRRVGGDAAQWLPRRSNRIEPILGGCALRETWSGTGGSDGTSYNAYDASRKRWHQTWVDNQGTVLVLEGAFSGGKMRLEGETLDTAGRTQR